MSLIKKISLGLFMLALLALGLVQPSPADEPIPESVRIGMVKTLFRDVPNPLVQILLRPFGGMMKDFTGIDGNMALGGDPLDVAKQVNDGKLDLAIFHGVEFAWAQQKYPQLRPLMIAVNKYRYAQCYLVVSKEAEIKSWADLKNKNVAFPFGNREHARLFLSRQCNKVGGCEPKQFFAKVVPSANMEAALDDVCSGTIPAAVVEANAWDNYGDIKPGCHARLKILQESERFPAGTIGYRDGGLSAKVVTRFREGLVEGSKSERGRDMMSMFRISAFENVPEDYQQQLADIIKLYPAPESPASVSANQP